MKSNISFKQIVLAPLAFIGVIVMLIEEWLWVFLVELGHKFGQLPQVYKLEDHIRALTPKHAALVLFTPVLLILPIKFLAVAIMADGHWILGFLVLIGAKLTGTVLVARIYTLCEPALMMLGWFVRLRQAFLNAKDWAHRRLEAWKTWQMINRLIRQTIETVRSLVLAGSKPE